MNYNVWKQNRTPSSPDKETFEKFQKEYGIILVEQVKGYIAKSKVRGRCLTTDCENNYEKQFRTVVNAPFCDECLGHKPKRLFVEEYPEIVKKIIKSKKPVEKLTCGSRVKITLQCEEHCTRCYQQHEYEIEISTIDKGGGKCSFCSGRQKCSCQKDDEFRCFECKLIKPLSDKCSGNINQCRACKRVAHERTLESFMKRICRVASDLTKKKERKKGDLTYEYLLQLYEQQQGRCYISNIPLVCKSHSHWKTSIERLNNEVGYSNSNVKLIVCELQSMDIRQWTMERWDEVCAITLGALENIPDETELLEKQVELAKRPNVITPRMKKPQKTEINEQGLIKCKKCMVWLDNTKFALKHNGVCRACEMKRKQSKINTLRGTLLKCLGGTRTHAKERGDTHEITLEDLLEQYKIQGGRCYYSHVPLAFSGFYQMSIDRTDVTIGYTKDNIKLVICGLNVGDWSRNKNEDDTREGSSGWNREKFLWAVQQNCRDIHPKSSYLNDVYTDSTPIQENSIEQKAFMIINYHAEYKRLPDYNYITNDGVRLGSFLQRIKNKCPSSMCETTRKKLEQLNPHFFKNWSKDDISCNKNE